MSDIVDDGMSLNAKISDILTDLIAELRDNYAGGRMLEMADRAEARLRELDTPTGKPNERIN